jgi:prolyl oligopeptidase
MINALLVPLALSVSIAAGPPPTEKHPVRDVMHGEEFIDNYRWLEALESDSPAVADWTTLQNEYTRSVLDAIPGRQALEARLAELMSVGQVGLPQMRGSLYFNTKREGDQNQPVLYVRDGLDGEPRELLDINTLDDRGLYALDWYVPSPTGTLVAFGLSFAGNEMTVLHVMDVETGRWLADEIPGKVEFGGWTPDGTQFLYGKLDDPDDAYSRSFYWHTLGEHYRNDPLLITQTEPSRIPEMRLSHDGNWMTLMYFEGWSKQDLYAISVDEWRRSHGKVDLMPIAEDQNAQFLPQIIRDDTLYVFTTYKAPNGMVFAVDLNNPGTPWKVVIANRDDAVLTGISEAKDMIVAEYQVNATTTMQRFALNGKPIGDLTLPGIGSAGILTHYDRNEAFFAYESFNEPDSIYHVDLVKNQSELWARPDVPVDPESVVVKQEWCTSKDGTKVPMFIVHRKGLKKDGANPTIVYGYGGFNVSLTPWFNATNFPWYEGGGIWVVATLRGGGEFGEAWHTDGMLANKQNVYDDLYAVAEYLIDEGYTAPEHMACYGGSNGGLLTGVAAVQRPDLWACVVSAVPLLDMLRYQHFLMAKFWVPEYGDPEQPEDYQWLKAYSPYHNITEGGTYPAILFTAGENDNRVHPLHARKMVAALQATASNDFEQDPILLWVDREGGHGQGKPLHLRIRERADTWAFFMWQTGMTD